jgi:hypothetical protein
MALLIWSFLIYYLILFAACYVVVEFGQNYFYDEATPGVAVKVAAGTFLLAAMLSWTRSDFATMFTSDFYKTALQAIVWSGVFILVFRFHPWHGFGIGVATMVLLTGLSTIAADSMLRKKTEARIDTSVGTRPIIRRPSYGGSTVRPAPATAPEASKK